MGCPSLLHLLNIVLLISKRLFFLTYDMTQAVKAPEARAIPKDGAERELELDSLTDLHPKLASSSGLGALLSFAPRILMFTLLAVYLGLFLFMPVDLPRSDHDFVLVERWFNPRWATDDSLQQAFPFYKAIEPDIFKGDLITRMMEGYLVPVHYWLSYGITKITRDPVMTGHWVMLIQLVLTAGFITAAVKRAAGWLPALFSLLWFFHTRHFVQRLTCGLPRGWAGPVLAGYLYFAIRRDYRAVMVVLLIGAVTHPVSTFLAAAAHGLFLVWEWARSEYLSRKVLSQAIPIDSRQSRGAKRALLNYLAFGPVLAILTYVVVRMPPELGVMANYETAAQMPEFSADKGRFTFVPLTPVLRELRDFGTQAFTTRLYHLAPFWTAVCHIVILALLVLFVTLSVRRRRELIPTQVWCFGVAALGVYFLSRIFAFHLYVPNRHLQIPLALFFIVGFSVAFSRFGQVVGAWFKGHSKNQTQSDFSTKKTAASNEWWPLASLTVLAGFIFFSGGSGLQGELNFNTFAYNRGEVAQWIEANTPRNALIAGYPRQVDGIPLFGKRTVFVTEETAHPFYDKYYAEMKKRLDVSLRAHYAASLQELYNILAPHKIDYFVFKRQLFYPEELEKAKFFRPFDVLVRDLIAASKGQFAYRELPSVVNTSEFPAMPFKDKESAVVDVKALGEWLKSR